MLTLIGFGRNETERKDIAMRKKINAKRMVALLLSMTMLVMDAIPVGAAEILTSQDSEVVMSENDFVMNEDSASLGLDGDESNELVIEESVEVTEDEAANLGIIDEGYFDEDAYEVTPTETIHSIGELSMEVCAAAESLSDKPIELISEEYEFGSVSISEEMLNEKNQMADTIESLIMCEPGRDYAEDEVFFFADNTAEANAYADAMKAASLDYDEKYGIGTIKLTTPLFETIKAGVLCEDLPLVYPNMISYAYEADEPLDNTLFAQDMLTYAQDDDDCLGADTPVDPSIPNDPYYSKQYYMDKMLGMNEVFKLTKGKKANGEKVRIAIIDTGVELEHPDLADNIVESVNVVGEGDVTDEKGHGTHCAGIAAAVGYNSIGICGAAPEAGIIAIKASAGTEGAFYTSDTLKAIQAAIEKKADVISMSFGGYGVNATEKKLLDKAVNMGIVVLAAAGNEKTFAPLTPAAYSSVISVGAVGSDKSVKASYSNYGETVDIYAPGGDGGGNERIYSTVPGKKYDYKQGTSMATPFAAGTVALLIASGKIKDTNNKAYVAKIKSRLLSCTSDVLSYQNNDTLNEIIDRPVINPYGIIVGKNVPAPSVMLKNSKTGDVSALPMNIAYEEGNYITFNKNAPGAATYLSISGVRDIFADGFKQGKYYYLDDGIEIPLDLMKESFTIKVYNKIGKSKSKVTTVKVKMKKLCTSIESLVPTDLRLAPRWICSNKDKGRP